MQINDNLNEKQLSYSGHTWAVDGLDPVLLCAVVGEGFEVHGLEVALGALVFDFAVDGVDVVVDRPTELRLEVTEAEIRDTRRVWTRWRTRNQSGSTRSDSSVQMLNAAIAV